MCGWVRLYIKKRKINVYDENEVKEGVKRGAGSVRWMSKGVKIENGESD